MTDVIVSIISPSTFKLQAEQWQDEELDIQYIDIPKQDVSEIAFSKISRWAKVETFINGESKGFYTLIVKDSERFVLACGEIDKLRN